MSLLSKKKKKPTECNCEGEYCFFRGCEGICLVKNHTQVSNKKHLFFLDYKEKEQETSFKVKVY